MAVTPRLLEPGGLAASGLLPKDFPAAMAELSLLEAFDHLRAGLGAPASQPAAASKAEAAAP